MKRQKLSFLAGCTIGLVGLPSMPYAAIAQAESFSESLFKGWERAERLEGEARVLYQQGHPAEAILLIEEALSIKESIFGENSVDVGFVLLDLASMYQEQQGNYEDALPLFQRVLAIYEIAFDENPVLVGVGLTKLAHLYQDQGNYAAALPLFQRTLAIHETAFDESPFPVAYSLTNLANLYQAQGNYADALPLLQRALAIYDTTTLHERYYTSVAYSSASLAKLYQAQGNYADALTLHQRALAIYETAFNENHPTDLANSLTNLAGLYQAQGNYVDALPLYQRALAVREAALNENHPDVANSLTNLAGLYQAQRNYTTALSLYQTSLSIEENNLNGMLLSTAEERSQLYMNTLSYTTDAIVSFNIRDMPDSTEATQLALTTVLRRKGRVLDASNSRFRQLFSQLTPENQTRFDELKTLRGTIANRKLNGLGNLTIEQYQAELKRIEARAEEIEEQLASSSAEFRIETEPVTIAAVQAVIPSDTALVEFIRYSPFNPAASRADRWGKPRYAAYLLTQQSQARAIDIGDAATIDQLATDFQRALSTRSANADTIARELDSKLIAPIRPLLGDKTHLLLSPDSHLNLIPFDALVDENNDYLIESYQISYLTSGRDLLKLQLNTPSQQNPIIFANPNYGNEGNKATEIAQSIAQSADSSQRSVDSVNLIFGPLPGTAQEADAIIPFLPNATILTQDQATESKLRQVEAPSILHIATHGFFLSDVDFIPPGLPSNRSYGASLDITYTETPTQVTPSTLENPLLRSGLALAGANVRRSGEDDGIFTALEASGLNLYGTQLVVLSACETGVGSVSNGEGVYGLRRAFVMAGAESQLMSLWQVDDYGTSELMQLFYQNLMKEKQGRSEALRNAQIEMMNTGTYAHPYYWSSFIFSGDWRPLK